MGRLRTKFLLLGLGLGSFLASSPQERPAPAVRALGSVSGHVYCADTNAPARMAKVTLEPAGADDAEPAKGKYGHGRHFAVAGVETKLDGSFSIEGVSPGTYYVQVDKEGYLSPLAQFEDAQLEAPSPEPAQRVSALPPIVTVGVNQAADIDVRLERGATVSGTLRFDDGSPATDLQVQVLRKRPNGQWTGVRIIATRPGLGAVRTDDLGNYRIAGLPSDEYIIEADLALTGMVYSQMPGPGTSMSMSMSSSENFKLPVFSGGSTRKRDAVSFKVKEGDERTGEDLVIPIAKLHAVSGSVVAAHDGHVVNGGTLTLVYPDDNAEVTSVQIDKRDEAFHFAFVPEGEYLLKLTDPKDVVREETPNSPGMFPPSQTRERLIHRYEDGEQRITVRGDLSNISISVNEPKAATASAPQ